VGEALLKANEMARSITSREDAIEPDLEDGSHPVTEESIVHHAVGILQNRIALTQKLDGEYYSASETGLDAQRQFVDPLLYKATGRLVNKGKFKGADDMTTDARCLSIACDITTLSTSTMSPKHLGLAVYLHHTFGNRKLIDMMNALGQCISYTELRTFITSAALHVDAQQEPSDTNAYIPPEVVPVKDGGQLILAAADNWDHNEHTIDGKKTTHAMTSILVQASSNTDKASVRIKTEPQRTLDTSTLKGKLHCVSMTSGL
jgi:hypothetical protein